VLDGIDLFAILDGLFEVAVAEGAEVQQLWEHLLRRGHGGHHAGTRLACDGLLRQLFSYFLAAFEAQQSDERLRGLIQFQPVFAHIEQHLATRLTLADLAAVVGLQPTYFSNLFTRSMGVGPIAYINRRRIERAKPLLWHTPQPLASVAGTVGFCDEYYFARVFKQITGLTPGRFRRLHGPLAHESQTSVPPAST
jgi:YesN/AraC family two-component response regulator